MKKDFLRSGELARLAGVSRDTLRHYEKKGVLPRPRRTRGGYRAYPMASVERVRLIRQALKVGFTLDELSRFLRVRDQGGAPCRQVKRLAEAKLAEIETRLREMLSMRDTLRGILDDWEARLETTAKGERAALLDALAEVTLPVAKNVSSSWPKRKTLKKGRNAEYD